MADITLTARSVRPLPGAIVRDFIAGGSGNVGDGMYVDSTGKVQQAKADAAATAKAIGIVVSVGSIGATAFVSGDAVSVLVFGGANGFSGLTVPGKIYVSAVTAGKLADASPATTLVNSVPWLMGIAIASDTIFFEPMAPNPQANIADPSAGATIDTQARTAINAIILALEEQGILARNG